MYARSMRNANVEYWTGIAAILVVAVAIWGWKHMSDKDRRSFGYGW
jgi:hypothetical protein